MNRAFASGNGPEIRRRIPARITDPPSSVFIYARPWFILFPGAPGGRRSNQPDWPMTMDLNTAPIENENTTGENVDAAVPASESRSIWRRFALTLDMIKFAHSIFALPFALLAMIIAAEGWPRWHVAALIVAACVFARSAAMSFNRLLDERYDRANPRTRRWPLPAGLLSRKFVWAFWAINCAGFVYMAWLLNPLAFKLSPVCLAVLLGYSAAKRFTPAVHWWLGLALGIAPAGAWIGVRGRLDWLPCILSLGVMFWVAGFDLIYSCQDEKFDRRAGLKSGPARWGRPRALAASALCHALCLICFALFGWAAGLGMWFMAALAGASALLAWEQALVSPRDISKLNTAFFTANGWVSVLMFAGALADVLG